MIILVDRGRFHDDAVVKFHPRRDVGEIRVAAGADHGVVHIRVARDGGVVRAVEAAAGVDVDDVIGTVVAVVVDHAVDGLETATALDQKRGAVRVTLGELDGATICLDSAIAGDPHAIEPGVALVQGQRSALTRKAVPVAEAAVITIVVALRRIVVETGAARVLGAGNATIRVAAHVEGTAIGQMDRAARIGHVAGHVGIDQIGLGVCANVKAAAVTVVFLVVEPKAVVDLMSNVVVFDQRFGVGAAEVDARAVVGIQATTGCAAVQIEGLVVKGFAIREIVGDAAKAISGACHHAVVEEQSGTIGTGDVVTDLATTEVDQTVVGRAGVDAVDAAALLVRAVLVDLAVIVDQQLGALAAVDIDAAAIHAGHVAVDLHVGERNAVVRGDPDAGAVGRFAAHDVHVGQRDIHGQGIGKAAEVNHRLVVADTVDHRRRQVVAGTVAAAVVAAGDVDVAVDRQQRVMHAVVGQSDAYRAAARDGIDGVVEGMEITGGFAAHGDGSGLLRNTQQGGSKYGVSNAEHGFSPGVCVSSGKPCPAPDRSGRVYRGLGWRGRRRPLGEDSAAPPLPKGLATRRRAGAA